MANYLQLLRPAQYSKNLFVFLPLLISGQLFVMEKLMEGAVAFVAFCLLSSSVYIFNDWRDLIEDQNHPVKRNRPLALGAVSVRHALTVAGLLAFGCAAILALLEFRVVFMFMLYLVVNLGYSMGLKKMALIDVLIVASGIVFRFIAGGWAVNVAVESWLVILTFIMALMLALGKRLDDASLMPAADDDTIYYQYGYNTRILESLLLVTSALFLCSYLMFSMDQGMMRYFGTSKLFFSFGLVIAGTFRYLQLVLFYRRTGYGGRHFFKDFFLLVVLTLWVSFFAGLAALKTFFPEYDWILL